MNNSDTRDCCWHSKRPSPVLPQESDINKNLPIMKSLRLSTCCTFHSIQSARVHCFHWAIYICKDQFLYYLLTSGECDTFFADFKFCFIFTLLKSIQGDSVSGVGALKTILKFRVLLHPSDTVLPEASWRWKGVKFRTWTFWVYNFVITKVLNWLTFTPLSIYGFAFGQIFCDLSLQCQVLPERLQLIQDENRQIRHIWNIQELPSTQVRLK